LPPGLSWLEGTSLWAWQWEIQFNYI
jgi:hypothetical protein